MKITTKLMLTLLACLFIFSSVSLSTNEAVVTTTNENSNLPSIAVDNQVNSDQYLYDQELTIDGTTNGNVFAIGSKVTVKGEISGDLFVLAQDLLIEDTAVIHNNIFALASNFTMKGHADDVYALTKSFELTNSGYISRDAKLYADTAKLNGLIRKDADIACNNIEFVANAQSIIRGNLTYVSNQELAIPEGAVLGEVKYVEQTQTTPTPAQIFSSYVQRFLTSIIYAVVVILLAAFLTPNFAEKARYALLKKPYISAGIGILAIVFIPVVAIVLLLTGFLSYVSFALIAIYILVISITRPIFGMAIGKWITNKLNTESKGKFILFSILSTIALWLLQIVPYIGGYISLFVTVVGFGVFVYTLFIKKM